MLFTNCNLIDIHPVLEPPLRLGNLDIVPAHLPLAHPAILGERPVLEPVAPLPLQGVVLVLVLIPELYGDLVIAECEELLPQLVVLLLFPFLSQELDYCGSTDEKLVPVAPDGVRSVGNGDVLGVTGDVSGQGRDAGRLVPTGCSRDPELSLLLLERSPR